MNSESHHDSIEPLSEESANLHHAILSLTEELEAVDWYQQRAEQCSNSELRAVLVHNKNEEIEHATMILEWLRRNNPKFASNIATYIGASGAITEAEQLERGCKLPRDESRSRSLDIGSLKEVK